MSDEQYMREALEEAVKAYQRGESPVGAVMVRDGAIIARAGNQYRADHDPTAHAEILVMRQAGRLLHQSKFRDCVIYTTIEPCPMCANAMLQAEVPKVVFGGRGLVTIRKARFAPTNLTRIGPLLEDECRRIFIQWLRESGHGAFLVAEGL